MLRTDTVIKLLKSNKKPMTFEEIWKGIKVETMDSISVDSDEAQVKSDLYMSIMEDPDVIMIGDNKWDLKENFSFEEVNQIIKTRMTAELELDISAEKSDDTIEMELGIVPEIEGE